MGREAAVGRIGEFVRRAEDVEMRVAGERRQGDARLGGIRIGRRTGRFRTQVLMRFSGHCGVPLVYSFAPILICLAPTKGAIAYCGSVLISAHVRTEDWGWIP